MNRIIRFLVKDGGKNTVVLLIYSFIQVVCESFYPIIELVLLPVVIGFALDYISTENIFFIKDILFVFSFIIAGHFILSFLKKICFHQRQKKVNIFRKYYMDKILEFSMTAKYADMEDTDFMDKISMAQEGISADYSDGLPGILDNISELTKNILIILSCLTMIATVNVFILIPFIISCSAIIMILQKKIERIEYDFYSNLSVINRRFSYFTDHVADRKYSKDIRLYHAQSLILNKEEEYLKLQSELLIKLKKNICPYRILLSVVFCIQSVSVIVYGIVMLKNNSFDIQSFVRIVNASILISSVLSNFIKNISEMKLNCEYASSYVDLMASLKKYDDAVCSKDEGYVYHSEKKDIVFKNVIFSYPGSDIKILDGINLTVKSGTSLSIVGLNGQGKTTLIKLLCRFYDNYEGCIFYGDKDIRDIKISEWYKIITSVFQDFSLLPYTVSDNITSGTGIINNKEKITEILSPNINLEEVCGKELDLKGIDFSGGESQKIALARAFCRDSEIVVLDEPTASLDAQAEGEIYRLFHELTKGKTTFFISHRLASCKFTDRIVVLNNGRIVEDGTHSDLLKNNGLYSRLWTEQYLMYNCKRL